MGKRGAQALSKNPNWKGGRTVASNGYVLVKRRGHPNADSRGYVYEHRLVAEEKVGRRLKPGEQVHHVNGSKTDNRPENIQVCATRLHHQAEHRKRGSKYQRDPNSDINPRIACACGCGQLLNKYDRWGRVRRYISGHNHG